MARFVKYYDLSGHWLSKKPEYAYWWMDLIFLACWEKKKFFINGLMVECDRGQLAWSVYNLAERWKIDRQRVRTFLKNLEKDFMITLKSNPQTTIITICNYCDYQDVKPTDKPTANPRQTYGKPTPNPIQEIIEIQEVLETDISTSVDMCKSSSELSPEKTNFKKIRQPVKIPYDEIINLYQEKLPMLNGVYKLNDIRKKKIRKLWEETELNDLQTWGRYFIHISKSRFLTGKMPPDKTGRTWKADFDFLINETNFLKIAEDKYHEKI